MKKQLIKLIVKKPIKTKYFLGLLEEVNGEIHHTQRTLIRATSSKSARIELAETCKNWYDANVQKIDKSYFFSEGEIVITPLGIAPISSSDANAFERLNYGLVFK